MHAWFPRRSAIAFVLLAAVTLVATSRGFSDDVAGQRGAVAPSSTATLTAPLAEGDVAVSGFSGAGLAAQSVPAGVDPLAQTLIDPNGASLKLFDLSTLGGPTVGQVVDAPLKLTVPAVAIGQVFALTFDDGNGNGAPNLYAAATSTYGLQIVGTTGADGTRPRLKQGAPGAAFMPGQFGSIPGASPGSIYRIDGSTGAVTMFADTGFSGVPNSGAGIGGIAFDPQSHDLYAADLDTGLIHRFNTLAPGADLGQFDHGTAGRAAGGMPVVVDDGETADIADPSFLAADPSTWGLTQPQRRVTALAVQGGRLYYAVADGPSIWSEGLNGDGSFGVDARLELQVAAQRPYPVTSIAFDPDGDMVLAQRGTQAGPFDYGQFSGSGAEVLRYAPAAAGGASAWADTPDEYPVGLPDGSRMGAGGAAFADGYNPDGSRGTSCGATLLTTGDNLRDNAALAAQLPPGATNVAGVQVNDASLMAPQNVPPAQSAFLAFDPNENPSAAGHAGAVAVVSCLGGSASTAASVAGPAASASQSNASSPAPTAQNPAAGGTTAPGTRPASAGPTAPGTQPAGGGSTANNQPGGSGTTAPGRQPGGSGTTTANQPLTVTKAATATTCTEQGGCSFAITVHNPNQSAVPGPFTVQDTFTAGGAQLTQSELTSGPDAPWSCVSAAAGGSLSCTNPGPIQPGDTTLNLTFAPGQTGAATDVLNCAQPGGANAAPVNLPPVAPATQPAPASTSVARTDIVLNVQPDAGLCSAAQGCSFEVNAGPGIAGSGVRGPLKFKITASLGADPTAVPFALLTDTLPQGVTCQPEAGGVAVDCTSPDPDVASNLDLGFGIKTTLPGTGAGALVLHASVQGAQVQASASNSINLSDGAPQGGASPDAAVTQQFQGPQCATIPLDKTKGFAPAPASVVNGLSIAKTVDKNAGPCTLNTSCSFDITITNTTASGVPGPISFADFASALNAAGVLPMTGATATGPLTCSPGEDGFNCVDKDSLAGGQTLAETITVPVSALLVGPGTQNCALLGGGQVPSCAAFPAPANPPSKDLTIAKTGPASCDLGAACDFAVTVTNKGASDFPGPVVFSDLGTAEGATFDGGNIATAGAGQGLTCTGGNPSTCTFSGAIPAGQSKTFDLSYTVTGVDPAVNLATPINCAVLEGDAADQSCVTVTVKGPPKPAPANNPAAAPGSPAQLKITKTAPGETGNGNLGTCALNAPCTFTVSIQNTGGTTLIGTLILNDKLNGTAASISTATSSDPWVCAGESNATATQCIDSRMLLKPGATTTFQVSATPGPTWVKGNLMQNCVSINAGGDTPSLDPGSRPCGTAKLDPFNVQVQKSGDQSCQPGADCHFSLTLFDPGPIDHDAPVTISDKLNIGSAPITSISPPLPCAQQPTQVPFACTSPGNFPMKVGESHTYNLTVQLPAGANSYTNCATVGPEPDPDANIELGAKSSCVTTAMQPPPAAHLSLNKTGPASCESGQPCAFSLTVTNDGNAAFSGKALLSDTLDIGSAPIQGGVPVCQAAPTSVPFRCTTAPLSLPPGATSSFAIILQMPTGTATSATNCAVLEVASKADEQQRGTNQSCATVALTPPNGTGGSNGTQPQPPEVPAAQAPANTAPQPPACFSNMVPDGKGGCQCPPSTGWDGMQCSVGNGGSSGVEPQPNTIPACPNGTIGAYPNCRAVTITPKASAPRTVPVLQCPANTTGTFPNCKPVGNGGASATQLFGVPRCPAGMVGSPPACSCPSGMHISRSGRSCVANPQAAPQQPPRPAQVCPGGMTGSFPNCSCPSGTRFSRRANACEPNPTTFGNGGTNFPIGNGPGSQSGNPSFGGSQGRHPRNPSPNNNNSGVGSNGTGQQPTQTPTSHACPPGEHYMQGFRRCVRNLGTPSTTTTRTPTAPAPTPDTSPPIVDFGACPACQNNNQPEVVK